MIYVYHFLFQFSCFCKSNTPRNLNIKGFDDSDYSYCSAPSCLQVPIGKY